MFEKCGPSPPLAYTVELELVMREGEKVPECGVSSVGAVCGRQQQRVWGSSSVPAAAHLAPGTWFCGAIFILVLTSPSKPSWSCFVRRPRGAGPREGGEVLGLPGVLTANSCQADFRCQSSPELTWLGLQVQQLPS